MATGAVWTQVEGVGQVLQDPGTSGLPPGMMLPGNADAEHYALTGSLRIEGTEGAGTPAAMAGYTQSVGTATGETFEQWKAATGYEDGVDYGGYTAYELFGQVTRAGGTSSTYDPFTGWAGSVVSPPTDPDDPDPSDGDDADTIRRAMEDAFVLALQKAGLEPDLIKTLWAWAEKKLVDDPSFTATRALLEMYDHEAFQTRFPAIKAMHDAGVTRRDIPTPGQYIAYERELVREMNRVGIDMEAVKADGTREVSVDTIVEDLLVGRVGMDEAISRLNEAKRMMYDVPAAVKEIFLDWAPTDSEGKTRYPESTLMQAFLDPNDRWSDIQEQIAAAETAGGAKLRAGLDISREMAGRIANVSNDQAAIWTQFAELKTKEALFAETLTEDVNLRMEKEGVAAQFQLGGIGEDEDSMTGLELSDLITRRAQTRRAAFSGGGGGAMVTAGRTGFGAVNA